MVKQAQSIWDLAAEKMWAWAKRGRRNSTGGKSPPVLAGWRNAIALLIPING
jgi:hypothetical protein